MILVQATASVKGNEITFWNELHEKYTVSLADAKKTGLYRLVEKPEELPEEADDEMLVFLSQKLKCLHYAAYLLDFGDKSKRALSDKLRKKGYANDVCEAAVAVLEKNGLLDDERLCADKLNSLAIGKLYGPRRLKTELFAKGFGVSEIQNALDEATIDYDELLEQLVRKLTRRGLPQSEKELSSLKNKLVRYGYGYDRIARVLDDLDFPKEFSEHEDW